MKFSLDNSIFNLTSVYFIFNNEDTISPKVAEWFDRLHYCLPGDLFPNVVFYNPHDTNHDASIMSDLMKVCGSAQYSIFFPKGIKIPHCIVNFANDHDIKIIKKINDYNDFSENIEEIKRAKDREIVFDITCLGDNFSCIVNMAKQYGIKLNKINYVCSDDARLVDNLSKVADDYKQICERCVANTKSIDIDIINNDVKHVLYRLNHTMHRNFYNCNFGRKSLVLDIAGNFFICPHSNIKIANVDNKYIEINSATKEHVANSKNNRSCDNCDVVDYCIGGCIQPLSDNVCESIRFNIAACASFIKTYLGGVVIHSKNIQEIR